MPNSLTQHSVSSLIARGRLAVGDGYRAKNSELGRIGLPFARAGNITSGFAFHDCDYFPPEHLDRVGNKVSKTGDVVFTSKGTVGRFAWVRTDTPRFVYSPQLCFWRSLDSTFLDPRYLYFWMTSRAFAVQFKSVSAQTDMAEYVSLTDQRRMTIGVPPLAEQRAIAHILGTLDDRIELNCQMSAVLEAMTRALFESWFVKFEPVRAKAEGRDTGLPADIAALFPESFDMSEIGEVPKGWRVRSLDACARFLNGLALQRFPAADPTESLPVIKIAQLTRGDVVNADRCAADLPRDYLVDDGDILFSWSGSLVLTRWTGGAGALNQHLFKVIPNECPRWFIFEAVRTHLPEFQRIAAGKATTMGHIQRHHLTDAKIAIPVGETIDLLGEHIDAAFERQYRLTLQSRTLAALRDTLLPKLLSGDLRLPDAERFLADAGVS